MKVLTTYIAMINGDYTILYYGHPLGMENNIFYFYFETGSIIRMPDQFAIEHVKEVFKEYE